jgi:hypothetical protein
MRKFNHISIEKVISAIIVTAMGGTVISAFTLMFYNIITKGI